jgi:type IV secretion system protein VirB6
VAKVGIPLQQYQSLTRLAVEVGLIVRGISGNLMVAAAPAVVAGSTGIMRGLFNTTGVKGRSRIGTLTNSEAFGRAAGQMSNTVGKATIRAGTRIVKIAERAKKLEN